MEAALFLDRDGIVNVDGHYVHRKEDFHWCDGIFELGERACRHGYKLVVITNQSGIGRGLYTEADFAALTQWMCTEMARRGAPVARVYHCPYHPQAAVPQYRADHPWRKPAPGMILQAQVDLGLDLRRSILLGDRASDILAAARAGIGTSVFVGPDADAAHLDVPASATVRDVRAAVDWFGTHLKSVVDQLA